MLATLRVEDKAPAGWGQPQQFGLLPPCDSQVLLLTSLPFSWELSLDMLVAVQMIPTSAMIVTIPTITAMKTVALRVWRMYFCSTVSSVRIDVARGAEANTPLDVPAKSGCWVP